MKSIDQVLISSDLKSRIVARWTSVIIAGLCLGIGCRSPVLANEFTEDDFLADIPSVLSASRLSQPKSDSPASTTIIDQEAIEASGALELAEVLRLVPGFQVSHVSGNSFAVTYHGLSFGFPKKFQVLVDGRSVYRPLLTNVDWATLGVSLEDVDRIEVVRGPNAPAYGSNAVLGTINIITRQPFEDHGNLFRVTRGDLKTDNVSFRHANSLGDLDYRLTARHIMDDGFSGVSDSKNIDDINIRAQYSTVNRNVLDWSFGYVYGEMGVGLEGNPLNPARNKEVRNSHVHMRWTQTYSSTEELYMQVFYNKHEQRDDFSNTISGFLGITPADVPLLFPGQQDQMITLGIEHGVSERTELEMQHSFQLMQGMRMAWGGSVRHDAIKSVYALDQVDYLGGWSSRVFLNGEWQVWDPLLLNLGLMVEQLSENRRYDSPRFAVNYKLNDKHSLRFSRSRAHRAPTLFEINQHSVIRFNDNQILDIVFASNPNLEPEKLISYEAAYLAELPQLGLSFDVKLFREKLSNIILSPRDNTYTDEANTEPVANVGAKVWTNAGHADTKGIEFQLAYQPWFHTKASLQYSYAKTSGVLLDRVNPERETTAVDNVPRHTTSFYIKHNLDRIWWGSVMFHRVSAMEWDGEGDHVDSYSRLDLQLVRKLEFGLDSSSVNFIVHNLLDDEYHEFRRENTFGRRVYLKFKAGF